MSDMGDAGAPDTGGTSASGGGGAGNAGTGGSSANGGSRANGGGAGGRGATGGGGGSSGRGGTGQGGHPAGGAGMGGAGTGGSAGAAAGSGGSGSVSPYPAQIAIGSLTICALISDGRVYCWGQNVSDGTNTDSSVTPVQVMGLGTATQITASGDTTCVVLSDHTMKCWGADEFAQITADGIAVTGRYSTPTQIGGLTGVSEAFTNDFLTCGLLTNGTVRCWGASDSSGSTLTGIKTMSSVANAAHLGGQGDGYGNVCAVLTDNTSKCWLGTTVTPVALAGLPSDISQIAGNCALSSDGTVRCWGPGGKGQIGNGMTDDQTTPQKVLQLGTATSIVSGTNHVCAILSDQSFWCWGTDGSFDSVDYGPYPLSLDDGPVVAAAANYGNTCLIEADHTVKCWGTDLGGTPLGPNGTAYAGGNASTPIVIPNLPGEP